MNQPRVLLLPDEGPAIGVSNASELVEEGLNTGVDVVAVPVGRLDPAFFDLRTGVAGHLLQTLVNYHFTLAVVGPLPDAALESASFAAFVREASRGSQVRFVASEDDLGELG